MSDRPTKPSDPSGQPDPVVTAALRRMAPPEHGPGFWDGLDARLAAEPASRAGAATAAVPTLVAAPPPGEPAPVPPDPPLAEVVPLPTARPSRSARWLAAAAAALVVVLGVAALRSSSTDVTTTPAATTTSPSLEPTTAPPDSTDSTGATADPSSTTPNTAPTNTSVAPPGSARPVSPSSAVPRSTTTTAKPASLTLSPTGVGPLRLGMTVRQATATGALGGFEDSSGEGTCGIGYGTGSYKRTDFEALFLDGSLARIYAQPGSRLRTPEGIGVGSAASRLSEVPGTRVESPEKYGAGTDVKITSGNVGYLFRVENGAVQEWSVGTAAGLQLVEACS